MLLEGMTVWLFGSLYQKEMNNTIQKRVVARAASTAVPVTQKCPAISMTHLKPLEPVTLNSTQT